MQGERLSAKFENNNEKLKFNLTVLFFKEDNIQYAFIPSLDITGYGNTKEEARQSLEIMVAEFLKYTMNKKTLLDELKNLGWKIKKKNKPFTALQITDLLNKNSELKEIINTKQYSTSSFNVNLPAFA